jgi:hypothetical protein
LNDVVPEGTSVSAADHDVLKLFVLAPRSGERMKVRGPRP